MPVRDRRRERPTKQENEVAEAYGGKRQPASGALPHAKGDVVTEEYLIDAKTTIAAFAFTGLKASTLTKQASRVSKLPLFFVEFTQLPAHSRDWVIMPRHHFDELIGK